MTHRAEREAALLRKLHAEADRAEFKLAELKASLERDQNRRFSPRSQF